MRALRPVDPEHLEWLRPEGVEEGALVVARERMLPHLVGGGALPVYEAKRRAVYRVDDRVLGGVAVKEIRNERWLRAVRYRRMALPPGLREMRVGAAFAARGGSTPAWLAAALERDRLRLHRVFLFLRWIDGARSLGAFLRELGREPDAASLAAIADALLDAARLGLVHGRHSGDNLLVTAGERGPVLQVIDFAHASLGPGFAPSGFARDAGRIAAGLVILEHASGATAARLLDAIAARWPDAASAPAARDRLEAAYRRALAAGPPTDGGRSA